MTTTTPSDVRMPLLDAVLEHRMALISALAVVLLLASWAGTPATTDWFFFAWGSDTLFGAERDFVRGSEVIPATGRGGLHLYADYPFLQIGPPALLLAKLLQVGPGEGTYVAGAVVQALGLLTVLLIDRLVARDRATKAKLLVASGLLLVVWTGLAHTRHLDDAIALVALVAAAAACRAGAPVPTGLLLGLAAASKPWAVGALPLLLGLAVLRQRTIALAAAVGTMALFWGPFVLGDPGTLDLGEVSLPFGLDSAPAALGATGLADSQHLRLLQFLGGMLVAAVVAMLGRWQLAPLAAFGLRLVLEPFPYQYYMASLATAALVADLLWSRWRVPVLTLTVVVAWAAISVVTPSAGGLVRLATFGGALLLSLAAAAAARLSTTRPTSRPT